MQGARFFMEFHLLKLVKFRRSRPRVAGPGGFKSASQFRVQWPNDLDPTGYHSHSGRVTPLVNIEAGAQIVYEQTATHDVEGPTFLAHNKGCLAGHELDFANILIEGVANI